MANSIVVNKKGFTLVWVIITLMFLSILGLAIMFVSMSEIRHASRSEIKVQTDYIARSGVERGFQMLVDLDEQDDVKGIVDVANSLTGIDGDLGNGKYEISFDQEGEAYIIIRSEAENTNQLIRSSVSLYVPVELVVEYGVMDWEEAPRSWKRADNLWGYIDPDIDVDVNLTGRSIVFTGTPTKSPQNAKDMSTFRATVMLFRGYDNSGVTFQQQKNTNDISFDAEVLIFEGGIRLRDPSKKVLLNISEEVTDINKGNLSNWSYDGEVGFENLDRYLDFIGLDEGDEGYGDALEIHKKYDFGDDVNYGLVFFDSAINKDGISENLLFDGDGVYFYKNGIDLNSPPYEIDKDASGSPDLIIVRADDPIREQRELRQEGILYRASRVKQLYVVD